ncbi:MAG TPA: hypothetical protein VFW11_23170 [Cyclobacteriaceae bacterium]|nr:hypothetical protein [Cyclobacteriaceae bacterium]
MKTFLRWVLLTALLVGTTDLIAAYVDQYIKTGKFADRMLYYIAGGALGLERSMQGGFWIGLLGLAFHYFIAFSFTLLFFLAFPRLKFLFLNKYLVGLLYGLFVGAFMSFIVLPLTRLPPMSFSLQKALVGWAILGVVLGIPIAMSAHKFYSSKDVTSHGS